MDKKQEYRVAVGSGTGLALLGWFGPYVWHEMPTLISYPAIAVGASLLLWGVWPPTLSWFRAKFSQSQSEESYLPTPDVDLSMAVWLMSQGSAWAKWYRAQHLSSAT